MEVGGQGVQAAFMRTTQQELLGMRRAGRALDAPTITVLYWWLPEGGQR